MRKKYIFSLMLALISYHSLAQVNSVIVKINPKYLDHSIIDDKSITDGEIETFLTWEGIQYLENFPDSEFHNVYVRKVFPFLTTNDTVSISRTGAKVHIPSFWSVFAFNTQLDVSQVCVTLRKLSPFVIYAHPNYEIEPLSIPNDDTYPHQKSLNSTEFPNAHVSVEPAWYIETGKRHIKVGVYDTGLDSSHADMNVLTGFAYGEDSKYDEFGDPIESRFWGYDDRGHGTSVGGIIGARRNNNIGIAGIAGGDGTDTSGVSLIDMKIIMPGNNYVEGLAAAIVDGARAPYTYYNWQETPLWNEINDYNTTPGFGLHIANHSYSFVPKSFRPDEDPNEDNPADDEVEVDTTIDIEFSIPTGAACELCMEALIFSDLNNVANVVARGNHRVHGIHLAEHGAPTMFPQKVPDHMVINVSGTSHDGNRWTWNNNSPDEGTWASMLGDGIDVAAPATNTVVHTLRSNDDAGWLSDPEYDADSITHGFGGTSSAAPHVSGALGLLLSYYNKPCYSNYNLANEDMEYLLQRSATDIHSVGYDDTSGWGRLHIERLLKTVRKPHYQVIHPQTETPLGIPSLNLEETVLVNGNSLVSYGPFGTHGLASEIYVDPYIYYWVQRYKVTATYDFSEYMTDPDTELIDAWVRKNTSTFGQYQYNKEFWETGADGVFIDGTEYYPETFEIALDANVDTIIGTKITLSGYLYKFIEEFPSEISMDIWYPVPPEYMHFDYSIYLQNLVSPLGGSEIGFDFPCDSSLVLYDTTASVKTDVLPQISVYPNPYKDGFVVSSTDVMKYVLIRDVKGAVVYQSSINNTKQHRVNLANISKGVYFADITLKNGKHINHKIVKQ